MTDAKDEEELARYFEGKRGDISQWHETPTKIRVRRGGPSSVFSIRFTSAELKLLQSRAATQGVTISEFVRSAALKAASEGDVLRPETAAVYLRLVADYLSSLPRSGVAGQPAEEAALGEAGERHRVENEAR